MAENKILDLMGGDIETLNTFFSSIGEKKFRSTQVIQWIHKQGICDINDMTNLSKKLRTDLPNSTVITVPKIVRQLESTDGTIKWLLELEDKNIIETVYIPEKNRGTVCISSQAACQLNCTFCATAQQGFSRNLKTSEIIGQLWLANNVLKSKHYNERRATNVVMMGMGEPLLNINNVIPALNLMLDNNAYNLSRRRVTVSTAGIIPGIEQLGSKCNVSLAISLHASNDELRNKLVPLNKKYPIENLIEACKTYANKTNLNHITFEYIMLNEINDSSSDAYKLISVLDQVPAKVNLIPFNPVSGMEFEASTEKRIDKFQTVLNRAGITTTIRRSRGQDIAAACGQLSGDVKLRKNKRSF